MRVLPRTHAAISRTGQAVLCCIFMVLSCVVEAQSEPADAPRTVSDMLAVQGKDNSSIIYLADATGGAIYSLPVSAASPQRLAFSDFHVFFKCPEFPSPTALAYQDGKLFVYDNHLPALFMIDVAAANQPCNPTVVLDGAKFKDLLKEKTLMPPISIAVSSGGLGIIAGTAADKILWHAEDNSARLVADNQLLNKPKRLAFNGSDLIVLNGDNELYAVAEKELATPSADGLHPVQIRVPEKSKSPFSSFKDTCFSANIFYATDGRRLVAFPASKGGKSSSEFLLPVFLPDKETASISRLSVTPANLFVADVHNNLIWNLPRPVPATVSIEADPDTASEAQLAVYDYLFSRGLLPLHEITTQARYFDVESLVAAEKLLLPGLPEGVNRSVANRTLLSRMAKFICKINQWTSCPAPDPKTGQYAPKPIGAGQGVVLPDVPVISSLRSTPVYLNGKQNVKDYLQERVLLPEQLKRVTGRYLATRNEAHLSTPSAVLAREGFLMASQSMKNLQPGTLISFSQGQETLVGNLNDCGSPGNDAIQRLPYSLPPSIVSQRFFDLLPSEVDDLDKGIFNKRNIQKVEAKFESVLVEKLSPAVLVSSLNQCRPQLSGGKHYVVLEALKVPTAKYKFLRKDGSTALISDDDLQRFKLEGRTDPDKLWSFLATEPVYLGVRLAEIYQKDDQTLDLKAVSDPGSLKPGISQDIFNIREGLLNLPATTWQLSVLINAAELENASSEWRQQMTRFNKTYLLSKQRSNLAPTGSSSLPTGLSPQDAHLTSVCFPTSDDPQRCFQLFKAKRGEQLRAINYFAPDDSDTKLPKVIVGIAELSNNTKRDIPAFIDNKGRSAWFERSDDCGLKRRTEVCVPDSAAATANPTSTAASSSSDGAALDATNDNASDTPPAAVALTHLEPATASTPAPADAVEPPLSIAEFQYPLDHGTFVAGLLAARAHGQPETAGLLPQIGLFLIDLNDPSPDELIKAIIYAREKNIRILNFSFEIKKPMDDPTNSSQTDYSGAIQSMASMKDMLFIVAAGNNNHDLRTSYHMPIAWITEVQSMIGVGASDKDKNFAKVQEIENETYPISNYSKKHIQLIAPGVDIYSIKPPNQVTKHSGSSYAAPQVTAAAAMLSAQYVAGAMQIKARLIYTADWNANYANNNGEVWGGMLNYKNAAWEPHRNLVKLTGVDTIWAVEVDNDPKIKIKQGTQYSPDNQPPLLHPLEIYFKQVLRIQRYTEKDGKSYRRVIYLDQYGYVKIVNNASIEDKTIRFSSVSKYNGTSFESNASFSVNGKKELSINSIENYIAETPNEAQIGVWVNPWSW